MFLPNLNLDNDYSLSNLNRDLKNWINLEYHKRIHSVTAETPIDRYINDSKYVKIKTISKNEADDFFYHTIYRLVRGDCVISVRNTLYEVPAKYIGKKLEIRHPLDNPYDLRLFDNNKQVLKLTPLDKHYNACNTINYYKEDQDHV